MPGEGVPVSRFRDSYCPDSYWPGDYLMGAVPILKELGWLARPLGADDRDTAGMVLQGLNDLTLDVTDVFPFGLLWALRSTGALREVDGLDVQLRNWREWEETDHLSGDDFPDRPLGFLPALPRPGQETPHVDDGVVLPPGGAATVEWWGRWHHPARDGREAWIEPMMPPDSEMSDRTRAMVVPRTRAYYERKLALAAEIPGRGELLHRTIITWPDDPTGLPGARYVGPWQEHTGEEIDNA